MKQIYLKITISNTITQTHYEDIRFYQTILLTKLHTKVKPIKNTNKGKPEKNRERMV